MKVKLSKLHHVRWGGGYGQSTSHQLVDMVSHVLWLIPPRFTVNRPYFLLASNYVCFTYFTSVLRPSGNWDLAGPQAFLQFLLIKIK